MDANKINGQTATTTIDRNRLRHASRGDSSTDAKTLLDYTKCFLVAAYFVFIGGSSITLNELYEFLLDHENTGWLTAITLLILSLICLFGLWSVFKEDSFLLIVYGIIVFIIFVLHVVLLFFLKNICTDMRRKCSKNMATPPGVAPILITVSELAIAICAFFMAIVIESEKRRQSGEPVRDLS